MSSGQDPAPTPEPEASACEAGARPLKRLGIGLNVGLQLLLALVLFSSANYLGFRHFLRFDLTPSEDYTLSESTEGYIRKLGKDVEITVVFMRDSRSCRR